MRLIGVLALLLIASSKTAGAEDMSTSQVSGEVHSADGAGRRGYVAAAIATDYQDGGLEVPIRASAVFAPLPLLVLDARAKYSINGQHDVHGLEAGGGATLCLIERVGKGPLNLKDGIAGRFIVTENAMIPGAERRCLGPSAGAMVQSFAVEVGNAMWAKATAPILYAGFRLVRRMRADVTIDGVRRDQSMVRTHYLEGMIAPSVSADVPAGIAEPTYKKYGGRIGFESARMFPNGGLSWGLEGGVLPGGAENWRIYLRLYIGVAFGV